MCLIMYATTETACAAILPSHINGAWTSNPDGVGFAFRRSLNDRVEVRKGFMHPRHAIQALHRIQAFKPVELCVHWRFGTSGGVTPGNTHPFVMEHGALIHNGILSLPGTPRESDTRRAARLLNLLPPAAAQEVLETWRNGSRLLYMAHKRGQTWREGSWLKTKIPGCIMSQSYSLPELAVWGERDEGTRTGGLTPSATWRPAQTRVPFSKTTDMTEDEFDKWLLEGDARYRAEDKAAAKRVQDERDQEEAEVLAAFDKKVASGAIRLPILGSIRAKVGEREHITPPASDIPVDFNTSNNTGTEG